MRSAKNTLREAEDSVFASPAGTGVHHCRPFAALEVSSFTAAARRFGARALLGWRCALSTPEAGVVVYWQPKR